MLRIFLALWLALTPALSWAGSMSLLGVGKPSATGGPPSYAFLGASDAQVSSGNVLTFSVTGNGATGRLIVAHEISSQLISTMILDPTGINVTLTQDYFNGSGQAVSFYSASIPAFSGAKNIVVTYATSVAFFPGSLAAWNASNLTTGFVTANQGPASLSITVTSGEFLFAMGIIGISSNFSGSTSAPTGQRLSTVVPPASQTTQSADWSTPTVGSFTVTSGSDQNFAATYK